MELTRNFFNPEFSKDTFFYLKFLFIIYLIISSIMIKHLEFIKNNGSEFANEIVICLVSTAIIPLTIINLMRGHSLLSIQFFKNILIVGVIFCAIHTMLEINGVYSLLYNTNESFTNYLNSFMVEHLDVKNDINIVNKNNKDIKKELAEINKTSIKKNNMSAIGLTLLISLFIMVLYIIITGIMYGLDKNNSSDVFGLSYKWLLLEGFLVGLFVAIPLLYISYNRQNKHFKNNVFIEMIMMIGKIFLVHIVLHYTQFYKSLSL
jgi:hypothetical protein